jgi:glycogen debranching enzyme
LAANRRLDDGTFWTTGLANGLDNSPSLGDGYPDLTAQMAHHAECLAQMAEVLGLDAEARSWREARDAIGRACNARLWSDEMGLYSTSLSGGGHNPNKVVTGFWPLWAGIVPPERVERLARQLKDPATFWRHHPAPSLAADAPDFHPGGDYWLGSTWAPTNCMVAKGFQRAGRLDLAREFVHRHLTVMSEVLAATGRIWENYCSEKSERGNISCHDYSWSAVGPIALLMEVVLGLEPDAPARRLRWTPPVGEECGVDRYPLGPCTISLRQKPDGAIEVETDLPFTLVLVGAGGEKVHACAGGRQSFKA